MDTRIIPEKELEGITISVPDDSKIFYFKLIGVGPNTLKEHQGQLPALVKNINGYFIAADANKIEQELKNFIEKACKS